MGEACAQIIAALTRDGSIATRASDSASPEPQQEDRELQEVSLSRLLGGCLGRLVEAAGLDAAGLNIARCCG